MRKLIAFLLLGGGMVAGWQYMHPGQELSLPGGLSAGATAERGPPRNPVRDWSGPAAIAAGHATTMPSTTAPPVSAPSAPTVATVTIATDADRVDRTFSPNRPLFTHIPSPGTAPPPATGKPSNGGHAVATVTTAVTPLNPVVVTTTSTADTRSPAGADAQRALVRDIQKELKRVGCYNGEASGQWSRATTRAMATFVGSSNASLPVDKPDVAFLAMLKAERADRGCSPACGSGEVSAGSGVCVPRPILASRSKGTAVATATPVAANPRPEGAMAIGGPKVEQSDDDAGISQSVANPQPAPDAVVQPQAVEVPRPAVSPRPVAKKPSRAARTASSRSGSRSIQEMFQHPLSR